jgi:hypothetical protein
VAQEEQETVARVVAVLVGIERLLELLEEVHLLKENCRYH